MNSAASWECFKQGTLLGSFPSRVESVAVLAGVNFGANEDSSAIEKAAGVHVLAQMNDALTLFVGTFDGTLFVYESCSGEGKAGGDIASFGTVAVKLKAALKSFHASKKPIMMLNAVEKWGVLLSVVDGDLLAHKLAGDAFLQLVQAHPSEVIEAEIGSSYSKGVLQYAANPDVDLLCVAFKRSVVIVRCKVVSGKVSFSVVRNIPTEDAVRAVQWTGPTQVCLGFAKDYVFVDVNTSSELKRPRTRTGIRKFPVMCSVRQSGATRLSEEAQSQDPAFDRNDTNNTSSQSGGGSSGVGEVLLCKDNQGYFIGFDGLPTREGVSTSSSTQGSKAGHSTQSTGEFLVWSEQPICLIACQPYIVALLPKRVEIHLASTCKLVQSIPFSGGLAASTNTSVQNTSANLSSQMPNSRRAVVFVANDKQVQILCMTSLPELVEDMLTEDANESAYLEALDFCEAGKGDLWETYKTNRVEEFSTSSRAGKRSKPLYVGIGVDSSELNLLAATVHARFALYFFMEGVEPCFKTAMKHLEAAKSMGRLPFEFLTMMFRRSELFESEMAGTTLSLNFADLRTELGELFHDLSQRESQLKQPSPCLAIGFETEDLVAPLYVEQATDLVYLSGNQLSKALLLVLLPCGLEFRRELIALMTPSIPQPSTDAKNNNNESAVAALSGLIENVQETLGMVDTLLLKAFVLCDAFSSQSKRQVGTLLTTGRQKQKDSSFADSTEMKALSARMMEQKMKFLRGKNWCHVEDCERLLLLYPEMWEELLWLYYGKGMHDSALEWLQKLDKNEQSKRGEQDEEPGPRETSAKSSPFLLKAVEYLKNLGRSCEGIVFKYAPWIIDTCLEEDSLEMFINIPAKVEPIDPESIVVFLERIDQEALFGAIEEDNYSEDGGDQGSVESAGAIPSPLAISFMRHVIGVVKSKSKGRELDIPEADLPALHNRLVNLYVAYIDTTKEAIERVHSTELATQVRDSLGHLRADLLQFLEGSTLYSAADAAHILQDSDLHEEYAIVLQRLGRHERALSIYIKKLESLDDAERYCEKTYDETDPEKRKVFLLFFKALIESGHQEKALQIGKVHVNKIDPQLALNELSGSLPIHTIQPFLEAMIRQQSALFHDTQVVKQLIRKDHISMKFALSQLEKRYAVITQRTRCANPSCRRPVMADQAFARLPNGDIVHYACLTE